MIEGLYQLYDKLFKLVAEKYPEEVLEYFLGELKKELEVTFLPYSGETVKVEFTIEDINYVTVTSKGEEYIINLECFVECSRKALHEAFIHNAFLSKKGDKVITIIFVLDDKITSEYRSYVVELESGREKLRNEFICKVVGLGDKNKLKKYKCLYPFLLKVSPEKYKDELQEVIGEDLFLRLMSVLILSRLGYSEEQAMSISGIDKQEFYKELLTVPVIKNFVEAREREKEQEKEKIIQEKEQEKEKVIQEKEQEKEKVVQELIETIGCMIEVKFGSEKYLDVLKLLNQIRDVDKLRMLRLAVLRIEEEGKLDKFIHSL